MSHNTPQSESEDAAVDGTDVLAVLGDECAQQILVAVRDTPLSTKEITDRCDVSSATVYRRINRLLNHGLLRDRVAFSSDSNQQKVYEPTFEQMDVVLNSDGFDVKTYAQSNEAVLLLRLLTELPFDNVRAEFSDQEVTLQLELTDELLGQFKTLWSEESL